MPTYRVVVTFELVDTEVEESDARRQSLCESTHSTALDACQVLMQAADGPTHASVEVSDIELVSTDPQAGWGASVGRDLSR